MRVADRQTLPAADTGTTLGRHRGQRQQTGHARQHRQHRRIDRHAGQRIAHHDLGYAGFDAAKTEQLAHRCAKRRAHILRMLDRVAGHGDGGVMMMLVQRDRAVQRQTRLHPDHSHANVVTRVGQRRYRIAAFDKKQPTVQRRGQLLPRFARCLYCDVRSGGTDGLCRQPQAAVDLLALVQQQRPGAAGIRFRLHRVGHQKMAALVLPLLQLLVQRQAVQLVDDARRFGSGHHLRRGGGDAFVGFGARGGHDGGTNHRAGDRTIYWMGKRARAVKHAFHRGFDRCRIVILRQRQRVTRLHAVARFKPRPARYRTGADTPAEFVETALVRPRRPVACAGERTTRGTVPMPCYITSFCAQFSPIETERRNDYHKIYIDLIANQRRALPCRWNNGKTGA